MDYHLISSKILDVFIECDVRSFPIDCFSILNHYGFRLYTYSQAKQTDEQLYDMCKKYSNDAFRYKKIICYNETITDRRIHFSLMHELGHVMLGHTQETPDSEHAADYFASNILAPRVLIFLEDCKTADDIHDTFGLSYAASNRALTDYKQWRIQRPSDTDKKIGDRFYHKQKGNAALTQQAATITQNRRESKQKPTLKWQQAEERIAFILQHDPDYFFRQAEKRYFNF